MSFFDLPRERRVKHTRRPCLLTHIFHLSISRKTTKAKPLQLGFFYSSKPLSRIQRDGGPAKTERDK